MIQLGLPVFVQGSETQGPRFSTGLIRQRLLRLVRIDFINNQLCFTAPSFDVNWGGRPEVWGWDGAPRVKPIPPRMIVKA